jgi:hypothetical protein
MESGLTDHVWTLTGLLAGTNRGFNPQYLDTSATCPHYFVGYLLTALLVKE